MDMQFSHRVFAAELMLCVMKKYSLKYRPKEFCGLTHSSSLIRFTRNIEEAVKLLVPSFKNFDSSVFMKCGETNLQRFSYLSDVLFTTLFEDGYNERVFLIFCIHVAKMATRAYLNGITTAPDFAINTISETINYFYTNLDINEESGPELDRIAREIVYFGGLY